MRDRRALEPIRLRPGPQPGESQSQLLTSHNPGVDEIGISTPMVGAPIGGNTDGLGKVAPPPPARGGAGGSRFPTSADGSDARRRLRPWSGSKPPSRQGRLIPMTRLEGGCRPGGRCRGRAGREEGEMRNPMEQILQ